MSFLLKERMEVRRRHTYVSRHNQNLHSCIFVQNLQGHDENRLSTLESRKAYRRGAMNVDLEGGILPGAEGGVVSLGRYMEHEDM